MLSLLEKESPVNPNSSLIYQKVISLKNKAWIISHCNNRGVIKNIISIHESFLTVKI